MATALQVSTFSYKSLATACLPLMGRAAAIVGLTFDATKAWPVYDWMGVAKAGLESASRYLALHLGKQGIRSNLVVGRPAAHHGGQVDPRASSSSRRPGPSARRSAGTSPTRSRPPAPVCALLSDWFPATTGEIVHVDGGLPRPRRLTPRRRPDRRARSEFVGPTPGVGRMDRGVRRVSPAVLRRPRSTPTT